MLRISLALSLLAGCASLFQLEEVSLPAGDGGVGLDTADASDAMQGRVWKVPSLIAELNSGDGEIVPSMTENGLHIMFSSDRGADYEIYVASRDSVNAPFGPPVLQTLISQSTYDAGFMTANGLDVLVTSIVGAAANGNVQHATRASTNGAFGFASTYDDLQSAAADSHMELSADGRHAVVTHGAGAAADLVLYTRAASTGNWGTHISQPGLNAPGAHDGSGSLTGDGLVLYFHSERSGARLIYTAKRATTNDTFANPTVVTDIDDANGTGGSDPWISPDGSTLLFERNLDLYITTRL